MLGRIAKTAEIKPKTLTPTWLLRIKVRMLTLKEEALVNAKGLKKAIASTRRLVDKSVESTKRFARESGEHHEAQSNWCVTTLSWGLASMFPLLRALLRRS